MSDIYGDSICIPGLTVSGDLSARQYHFVKWGSTADGIISVAATTDVIVGVLQDAPDAAGEAASVAALGITVLTAGTSVIAAGDNLSPSATGAALTGGAITYAQALEAATAIGDEFTALLGIRGVN